ncbi:MAG: hypothetical protein ABSD71_10090 [Bacteroidales bacterium]|jgi:hypothetical protein
MKTEPIHVREIQNAIVNLASLAETLFETETPYEALLKEVLKHRYSDEGWPPMKAYEEKLNLKSGQAKSMLVKIFNDLMSRVCAYKEPRYRITDVVHQIYVQNYGKSFTFRCQLPVTPKIGEQVEFPFLNSKVGSSLFHVSQIDHAFDDRTQTITLWLESGHYNFYKKFNEEKEDFERNL